MDKTLDELLDEFAEKEGAIERINFEHGWYGGNREGSEEFQMWDISLDLYDGRHYSGWGPTRREAFLAMKEWTN